MPRRLNGTTRSIGATGAAVHGSYSPLDRRTDRNILLAAEPEIAVLKEEFREHLETTRNLDTGSDDYDVQLQNQAARTGELAARAALLHGRLRAEIHAVLTEEQRALAAEGREHRRRFEHF